MDGNEDGVAISIDENEVQDEKKLQIAEVAQWITRGLVIFFHICWLSAILAPWSSEKHACAAWVYGFPVFSDVVLAAFLPSSQCDHRTTSDTVMFIVFWALFAAQLIRRIYPPASAELLAVTCVLGWNSGDGWWFAALATLSGGIEAFEVVPTCLTACLVPPRPPPAMPFLLTMEWPKYAATDVSRVEPAADPNTFKSTCYECRGTKETDCTECNGSGKVGCADCGGNGLLSQQFRCTSCEFSGRYRCPACCWGKITCPKC